MPLASAYVVAQLITVVSSIALEQDPAEPAYLWLQILLLIALLNELRSKIDRVVSNILGQRVFLATNELLFKKIYQLSQEQFDNHAFNTRLERSQYAITRIRNIIDVLSRSLSYLVGFLGSIIAISIIAPWVGLVIAFTLIPALFFHIWQNKIHDALHKQIEPEKRIATRSALDAGAPFINARDSARQCLQATSYKLAQASTKSG